MPVVVVATFYNGMPPQQIEADITNTFERFFTLAANVDHSESRSLTGVSLIKIYFKPGTDPNAALSNIANLAMADLAPPAAGNVASGGAGHGRLDAASMPGDTEGRGAERNEPEGSGAIPSAQPDIERPGRIGAAALRWNLSSDSGLCGPAQKMEARNLSLNDVVKSVDSSNLILPAGDVRIGSKDFNIYANSQFPDANSMNEMPLKSVGNSSVLVGDIGKADRLRRLAIQHRPHRRAALRLCAGFQAGRRQQHHHHREWNEGRHQASGRHSGIAEDRCRLRPVRLRQNGNRECVKGSRHRIGADRR